MIDVNGNLEVFINNEWREAKKVIALELDGMPIVIVDVPGHAKNLFFYPGDGSMAGTFMSSRVSIDFIPAEPEYTCAIRNTNKTFYFQVITKKTKQQLKIDAINEKEAKDKILQQMKDEEWISIEHFWGHNA
jgi:hypothetical protein